MFPRPSLLARSGARLGYRSQATTSNSTTIGKPAGVEVGDVVFFVGYNNDSALSPIATSGGSNWGSTSIGAPSGTRFFHVAYKVLNALDVANAWIAGNAHWGVAVAYKGNGATTITHKETKDDTANTGSATTTLTGFTPASGSKGTFSGFVDDDAASPSVNAGFISRYGASLGRGVGAAENIYYGGGSITWTGVTGAGQAAFAFEVT